MTLNTKLGYMTKIVTGYLFNFIEIEFLFLRLIFK